MLLLVNGVGGLRLWETHQRERLSFAGVLALLTAASATIGWLLAVTVVARESGRKATIYYRADATTIRDDDGRHVVPFGDIVELVLTLTSDRRCALFFWHARSASPGDVRATPDGYRPLLLVCYRSKRAMQSEWLQILERVLRPERPLIGVCAQARDQFVAERQAADAARAEAIATCEQRIHDGRAAVFAANDGVVPASMTELEREWRRLSRRDPDEHLMDLWARMAPPTWHDRKHWRHGRPGTRGDLAVALAADVAGVEAAEAAATALRESLAVWGVEVGPRTGFRLLEADGDATTERLAAPLEAATNALAARADEQATLFRMAEMAAGIREAAAERLPHRPQLARSIAHAALVDGALREAGLEARPNPVESLCQLWRLGYVPAVLDASGVTLELPAP